MLYLDEKSIRQDEKEIVVIENTVLYEINEKLLEKIILLKRTQKKHLIRVIGLWGENIRLEMKLGN